MNRNKKGVMPEITREIYKSAKKFDRKQFEGFCTDIYRYGFQDGRDSVPYMDVTRIYEVIEATKGVGPTLAARLKANIEAVFAAQA